MYNHGEYSTELGTFTHCQLGFWDRIRHMHNIVDSEYGMELGLWQEYWMELGLKYLRMTPPGPWKMERICENCC